MRKRTNRKGRKEHWTLVVIPANQERVANWKVPRWMLRGAAVMTIAGVVVAASFAVSYFQLRQEVTGLKSLKDINQQQKAQIQDLRQQTDEIQSRVQKAIELDKQVRELMGLELQQPPEAKALSSRGFTESGSRRAFSISLPNGPATTALMEEETDGLWFRTSSESEEGLLELRNIAQDLRDEEVQVDDQIANLERLQKEVVERQRLLAALPSKWPTSGRLTSRYGYRKSPFSRKSEFHDGIDIATRRGSPVVAAGAGQVVFVGWKPGYGLSVIIDHGYGYRTLYGHNSSTVVKVGRTVSKGEVISRVGSTGRSTGPHLHFTVFYNDQVIDPMKILQ